MKKKILFALFLFSLSTICFYTASASTETYNNITYVFFNGEYAVTKCDSSATEVEILSEINDIPVARINSDAFKNCTNLTKVKIPDSIKYIDSSAFYNCTALTEINIPDGIPSIEDELFYNCSSLTAITLPDSITYIGGSAFSGCSNLKSINIPKNTEIIYGSAFYNCTSLTDIVIPDSVTGIGPETFYNCTSLKNLTLGKGLTSIGFLTFYNCNNLENIYVSDITAYLNCKYHTSLAEPMGYAKKLYINGQEPTELFLPDGVKQIPAYAFNGCTSLTSIHIPKSVESIDLSAFNGCNNLTDITVDSENGYYSSIDGNLLDKNRKTLIFYAKGKQDKTYKIPDGVTTVGQDSLKECNNLERIIIPNSVTDIKQRAFYQCSNLSSLILGNGLKNIAYDTTQFSYKLKDIYYNGTKEDWGNISIETDPNGEPILYATKHFSFDNVMIKEKSDDGNSYIIHPFNVDSNTVFILSLYNNNNNIEKILIKPNKGTSLEFITNETYTAAQIMVWESMTNLKPVCSAEPIQ